MTIAKDKWMKYKGTSGRAVLTLCGVYGVAYLFSLQPVNRIYYSVLNVLLAVGIYSMLQQTEQNLRKIEEKRDRKRRICYVAVISFLFALSMVMGYQLQNLGMTDCGVRGKGMILIRALCLSVAAFPFANLLLDGIDRLSARGEATMSGEILEVRHCIRSNGSRYFPVPDSGMAGLLPDHHVLRFSQTGQRSV